MNPWYNVVTLRREVQEGRSFSPDEFAIALEQIIAGTAPTDYTDASQFFSRTCFTSTLTDIAAKVLRRLSGQTANTAPVWTLISQFGGGKTHALTVLYHLARAGPQGAKFPGVDSFLNESGIATIPFARIGVFVGNAWDPIEGSETPWIDIARQIAGERGVSTLGKTARTTPPGTIAMQKVFAEADAPVLLLFDEVLNFVSRHRDMANDFHTFIQNLTVAVTGTSQTSAVISLPRSQVEMTDWELRWQERITKVVHRVAQDLVANDESEISDVIRRRLFDDLGSVRIRKHVARTYANWCFERASLLPPEWLRVDSATTEAKAKDFLTNRFESCYPFHPATLSVFQRKWRALPQFQQTRGALAMLAQWISWAASEQFQKARTEPLITLGSAPLHIREFRSVVLGQLGESRLDVAIEADLAGPMAHARALDVDTSGVLRDIHRRVGAAILFESSGGQIEKKADLPELRFAIGEPDIDTATVDNAVNSLEGSGFFIRKVGIDSFRIHHQATLKKVVNDRRASLDEEGEVSPALRKLIESQFRRGATLPIIAFPSESKTVSDTPRLTLVLLEPEAEEKGHDGVTKQISSWNKKVGDSTRRYPGSLIWCVKKQGRELRERVATWLAWNHVAEDIQAGVLGTEYETDDRNEIQSMVREARTAAIDEIWAGYRFVLFTDCNEELGIRTLDLGSGHASSNETLCGRVFGAMQLQGLLSENVGVGYIERNWPPALSDTGAWPLAGLRQSFLDGSLIRLIDPDSILRNQIVSFVADGEFGLASGHKGGETYSRVWFEELVGLEEVVFDPDVFLLTKAKANELKNDSDLDSGADEIDSSGLSPDSNTEDSPRPDPTPPGLKATIQLAGSIPPESWSRFGTRVIPQMNLGAQMRTVIHISVTLDTTSANDLKSELEQILRDLNLSEFLEVKLSEADE